MTTRTFSSVQESGCSVLHGRYIGKVAGEAATLPGSEAVLSPCIPVP